MNCRIRPRVTGPNLPCTSKRLGRPLPYSNFVSTNYSNIVLTTKIIRLFIKLHLLQLLTVFIKDTAVSIRLRSTFTIYFGILGLHFRRLYRAMLVNEINQVNLFKVAPLRPLIHYLRILTCLFPSFVSRPTSSTIGTIS